jgi:hypothetical protein
MTTMRLVSVVSLVAFAAHAQTRCEKRGPAVARAPKTPRTSTGPDFAIGEHLVAFRSMNGRLLVRQLDDGKVRFNANTPGEVLFVDDTRVLLLRASGKAAKLIEVTYPTGAERETTLPVPDWAFRKPAGRWMSENHTIDVWPADGGWVMSWASTVPPGPSGIPPPPDATLHDCGSLFIADAGVNSGGFIVVPYAPWVGDGLQLDDGAMLRSLGDREVLQEADGGAVVLADRSKKRLGQGTYSIHVVGAWVRGARVVLEVQHDDGGHELRVVKRATGATVTSSALPIPPVAEPMPALP